ncbi:MAG: carboxypeptidase regulatory-like domain-containing protein [Acidobacteria bacterium]|nr:carboxypeptidase regulatory-like domain-containing protein [Acidobacteriota bacterium]
MKPCRIIAAIIWFCSPICAQSKINTGIIQGVVRDVTGGVLPETLIMAKHLGIGITRTCRASAEGFFTVALLPVGTYEITAHRTSLADVRITDITVHNGQTRSLDVTMRPASISEIIEVQAGASVTNPLLGILRRQESSTNRLYAGVSFQLQAALKYLI